MLLAGFLAQNCPSIRSIQRAIAIFLPPLIPIPKESLATPACREEMLSDLPTMRKLCVVVNSYRGTELLVMLSLLTPSIISLVHREKRDEAYYPCEYFFSLVFRDFSDSYTTVQTYNMNSAFSVLLKCVRGLIKEKIPSLQVS